MVIRSLQERSSKIEVSSDGLWIRPKELLSVNSSDIGERQQASVLSTLYIVSIPPFEQPFIPDTVMYASH